MKGRLTVLTARCRVGAAPLCHGVATRLILCSHVAVTLGVLVAALLTAERRVVVAAVLCVVLWPLEVI